MSDKFWETLFNPKTLLITNVTMFFNIFQYMFLYFTCSNYPFFRWQTKEMSKHSFLSKHIHLARTKKKKFLKWYHQTPHAFFHSRTKGTPRATTQMLNVPQVGILVTYVGNGVKRCCCGCGFFVLPVVLDVLAFLSFVVGGKGITCR